MIEYIKIIDENTILFIIFSQLTSDVMETVIVVICLMKLIVHHDSQVVATALNQDSNVLTTFVLLCLIFVMVRRENVRKMQNMIFIYLLVLSNLGTDDCGDNSDEASAVCSNFNCDTLRRFQCANHRCIARYQLCDGK